MIELGFKAACVLLAFMATLVIRFVVWPYLEAHGLTQDMVMAAFGAFAAVLLMNMVTTAARR